MAASEKLEAARRSGSLTDVIGALREEARTETANAGTSPREQVDVVDGSIRLAAHLTGQGIRGAERREAMRGVQVGTTVTAQGAAKTLLSRAEKIARVQAWGATLTEEQRDEYVQGEKFDALSDRQQEVIAEAFGQIQDRAYEDSIGIDNSDLDAPLIDIDQLPEDETESVGDSFEVLEGDDVQSFDIDDAEPWPGDSV